MVSDRLDLWCDIAVFASLGFGGITVSRVLWF